jgi:hypothetical protein
MEFTGGWLTAWNVYYIGGGVHLGMGGWEKNHLFLLLMLHLTLHLVSFILLLQDIILVIVSSLPINLPDS